MAADIQQVETAKSAYENVLHDVLQGRNLDKHLDDVKGAIENIDIAIANERAKGIETPGLERLRNEVFWLKWQILERM